MDKVLNVKNQDDLELRIGTSQESFIVLDLETTGLCNTKNNPKDYTKYNNCRIIEVGYVIYKNGEKISKKYKYSKLVLLKNKTITNTYIHGISNKMMYDEGIYIEDVLIKLYNKLIKYNVCYFIAHNVNFDFNILLSECYRYIECKSSVKEDSEIIKNLIKKLLILKKICTINLARKISKLHNLGISRFNLGDLYFYFFKKKESNAHRALVDVKMCSKLYFMMHDKYNLKHCDYIIN